VYGVHIEFVYDQRRSLLGHHTSVGLRSQTDTGPDDFMRGSRLDFIRLHFSSAFARFGQRTRTIAANFYRQQQQRQSPSIHGCWSSNNNNNNNNNNSQLD
jgi:hypothetical protein